MSNVQTLGFEKQIETSDYLQNHVVYRKRKIYVGKRAFKDLIPLIEKHKNETFLLPTTDKLKPEVPKLLDELDIKWKQSVFYKTVISDLSNLADVTYDVLVFFSPSGIESLLHNFPNFQQNNTRIAVFGAITKKAVEDKKMCSRLVWGLAFFVFGRTF